MIEPPPRLRIAGTTIFIPSQTPFWLTLTIASHSSSDVCSKPFLLAMPALLTRMSSPPNSRTQVSTAGVPVSRAGYVQVNRPYRGGAELGVDGVGSLLRQFVAHVADYDLRAFACKEPRLRGPCPRAPPEISATLFLSRSIFDLPFDD
jgi:hypothetical protein